MATREKQWAPPKGWELDSSEHEETMRGSRTYPDGTRREIVAHSVEEFAQLALQTDHSLQQQHSERRKALTDEAAELRKRAHDLDAQARQYDWSV